MKLVSNSPERKKSAVKVPLPEKQEEEVKIPTPVKSDVKVPTREVKINPVDGTASFGNSR